MIKIKEIITRGKYRKVITISSFVVAFIFLFLYLASFGTPKLQYRILTPEYIMSSIYKVHGDPNLGFWASKIILTNIGDGPVYDLKITYKLEGYADWTEAKIYPVLSSGSTIVDIYYPILSSEIAKLKTAAPSNIKIKITYAEEPEGKTKEINESKSISILGGHDFIFSSIPPEESTGDFRDVFSNYPLLAAWVTPADPVLMTFADMGNKLAGGAGAALSDEEALKSLSGIWAVAVNNGIQYKTEPAAFWTGKFSQFIKYPRDVIRDRAGTCIDTALFFASAASAQGLTKTFIVLMPGHAFPIIQLPSGELIPIESTALNNRVSFEQAVNAGVETYNNAMQGPYIIIDIKTFQGLGIIPPELEELPTDILKQWGISMWGGGQSQYQQPTSGSQPQPQPQPGTSLVTYTNPFPAWNVSYPNTWTIVQAVSEVDLYSPSQDVEFITSWGYGMSGTDVRFTIEEFLLKPRGAQIIEEGRDIISGLSAIKVTYQATINGIPYLLYARYFEAQDHGWAIIYDFPNDANYQNSLNACESILRSFSF